MKLNRRGFFQVMAAGTATALTSQPAQASDQAQASNPNSIGMLVDTTECIGCRKCEFACDMANNLTGQPVKAFEDMKVYDRERRMSENAFTVVNRYANPEDSNRPIYVKSQCMHCLKPGCTSACLVGALRVGDNGAVVYDARKCLGCRYCMVACPFQVPMYEYDDPLTPRVRKCEFCHTRLEEGKLPACAEMCPPMALTFGTREELLKLAHKKIESNPDRYIDHVYGEKEVGGTSWLYLASREFEKTGFLKLGEGAVPSLTEPIQHAIFKLGLPPLALYGLLGAMMWTYRNGDEYIDPGESEETDPSA